ncbi:TPA: hypothetical protein SG772_001647 [Campylobacter coli]|nr:hypothetical protein [Campylobacter coli]
MKKEIKFIGLTLLGFLTIGCGNSNDIGNDEICSNPKIIKQAIINRLRKDIAIKQEPKDYKTKVGESDGKLEINFAKKMGIEKDKVKLCFYGYRQEPNKLLYVYEKDKKIFATESPYEYSDKIEINFN